MRSILHQLWSCRIRYQLSGSISWQIEVAAEDHWPAKSLSTKQLYMSNAEDVIVVIPLSTEWKTLWSPVKRPFAQRTNWHTIVLSPMWPKLLVITQPSCTQVQDYPLILHDPHHFHWVNVHLLYLFPFLASVHCCWVPGWNVPWAAGTWYRCSIDTADTSIFEGLFDDTPCDFT